MNTTLAVRTEANSFARRENQVVITGDSQVRGYPAELAHNPGKTFDVPAVVMPGTRRSWLKKN
jgi:hypothetical protein